MPKIKSVSTFDGTQTQWNTPVPLGADDVNIDITKIDILILFFNFIFSPI